MLELMAAQPFWIKVWIAWLVFVNAVSVVFLARPEGRWVAAAGVANLATMLALYRGFGDARSLGLAHLVWWTPLVVYLFRRRAGFGEGRFGGWARLLVLTNAAALVVYAAGALRFLLANGPAA